MNRRTFLAQAGSVVGLAGIVGIVGCTALDERFDDGSASTTTPRRTETSTAGNQVTSTADNTGTTATSPPPSTDGELAAPMTCHEIHFETVLNAVDDLGMDPNGNEPIDAALEEAYGDGTLVAFPPGQYLARRQHEWDREVSGFGLVGLGETNGDVQFVFPEGNRGAPDPANYWFFKIHSGRDHLLENFTIDQTDDEVTGVGMAFYLTDGLHIQNVELAGFNPAFHHDPGFGIIAAITSRSGVGVIDGFTCTDGGVVDVYPKRKTPIGAFEPHVGELKITGAHIAESGSHSLYVSRNRGCVRVEDGLFVNNDNSNLRLSGGGHPEKRSWAKNCRILIDTDEATTLRGGEQYQGARGIWVESGGENQYGHTDLLLENVHVTARSNARPAVLLLHEHSHGSLTVRDSTFRSDIEGATVVDSRFPFRDWVESPYKLTLDNVTVATTAWGTVSGYAVRIASRPGSVVRNTDIDLSPADVDGLLIKNSEGARVVDVDIAAELSGPSDHRRQVPGADIGSNVGVVIKETEDYTIERLSTRVPRQDIRLESTDLDRNATDSDDG